MDTQVINKNAKNGNAKETFKKGAAGEKRNGTGGYDFIRNRYGGIDHWNDRAVFCLFKSEWSLCRYDDEWCEVILRQIS